MRLKINGNWRDISFIKLWDDAPCGYISTETMIEDIEINGRNLITDKDVDSSNNDGTKVMERSPGEFCPGDKVLVNYHNEPALGTIKSRGDIYAEIKLDNTGFMVFKKVKDLELASNVEVEIEPRDIKEGDPVMYLNEGEIEEGEVSKIEDGRYFIFKGDNTALSIVGKSCLVLGDKQDSQAVIEILVKQVEYWTNRAKIYEQQAEDYKLKATDWYCHKSHLAADAIDWEQRRFDIASKLYLQGKYMSQACLEYARAFVEAYKKEAKL